MSFNSSVTACDFAEIRLIPHTKTVESLDTNVQRLWMKKKEYNKFLYPLNIKYSVDKKNQLDVTFVFFISLLIVAEHVSGNHVPIIRC